MIARSSSFSADILEYHLVLFKTCVKFSNGICHQKKCLLLSTSHPHYLSTLGTFHNVTIHVDNCYESVLKFITLANMRNFQITLNLQEQDVQYLYM